MLIGGILVLYTGCGHFQTSEKKSIYEMLAQQYVAKSKRLWEILWSGTIFSKEKAIYEILAQRDAQERVITEEFFYKLFKETEIFNKNEEYNRQYIKLVEKYKNYEGNLKVLKKHLEQYPLITLFGGIDYTMTLNEMGKKIKEKFSEMKKNGWIISKDEFKKIEKNYFTEKPSNNLSRIWGVEYLKGKINKSEYLQGKYDVPKYVIVADDPDHIKVKLYFGNLRFPILSSLENATIYFIKIVGVPAGLSFEVKFDLSPIGFDDFSDPGNIIREKNTNMYYVVDTELKSFKREVNNPQLKDMLEYTRKRFLYFNKKILNYFNYTYDINLSVKKQSR